MIGPHRLISLSARARKSSGPDHAAPKVRSSSRCAVAGSSSADLEDRRHPVDDRPRHARRRDRAEVGSELDALHARLLEGRHVGQHRQARRPRHPERARRPALDVTERRRQRFETEVRLPAEHRCRGRGRRLVGNVDRRRARPQPEQHAAEVRDRPRPRRRVVELARVRPARSRPGPSPTRTASPAGPTAPC